MPLFVFVVPCLEICVWPSTDFFCFFTKPFVHLPSTSKNVFFKGFDDEVCQVYEIQALTKVYNSLLGPSDRSKTLLTAEQKSNWPHKLPVSRAFDILHLAGYAFSGSATVLTKVFENILSDIDVAMKDQQTDENNEKAEICYYVEMETLTFEALLRFWTSASAVSHTTSDQGTRTRTRLQPATHDTLNDVLVAQKKVDENETLDPARLVNDTTLQYLNEIHNLPVKPIVATLFTNMAMFDYTNEMEDGININRIHVCHSSQPKFNSRAASEDRSRDQVNLVHKETNSSVASLRDPLTTTPYIIHDIFMDNDISFLQDRQEDDDDADEKLISSSQVCTPDMSKNISACALWMGTDEANVACTALFEFAFGCTPEEHMKKHYDSDLVPGTPTRAISRPKLIGSNSKSPKKPGSEICFFNGVQQE